MNGTPLTPGWVKAVKATAAGVAVLGLIGFANSFLAVADAVAGSFDWPWTVPLGIDVAIAVFSAADIIQAKLNMRSRWLRFIPWLLVAATIYLNVAAETTWVGWVAHTALPALWVAAVEIGAHTVRVREGLASATRRERIPRGRWVLAPLATPVMWRRMALWGVCSYREALELEQDRILALAWLEETYGPKWRKRASPAIRALHRLGRLHPRIHAEGSTARLELAFHDPGTAVPGVPPAVPPQFHPSSKPIPINRMQTLAALVDGHPGAGGMTDRELAEELAPRVGLSVESTRKYLGRIPRSRPTGSTARSTGGPV